MVSSGQLWASSRRSVAGDGAGHGRWEGAIKRGGGGVEDARPDRADRSGDAVGDPGRDAHDAIGQRRVGRRLSSGRARPPRTLSTRTRSAAAAGAAEVSLTGRSARATWCA
jgi:hypothetical protein